MWIPHLALEIGAGPARTWLSLGRKRARARTRTHQSNPKPRRVKINRPTEHPPPPLKPSSLTQMHVHELLPPAIDLNTIGARAPIPLTQIRREREGERLMLPENVLPASIRFPGTDNRKDDSSGCSAQRVCAHIAPRPLGRFH